MGSKTFKTLDEQIEILRSKGLIIDDENIAKDILLWIIVKWYFFEEMIFFWKSYGASESQVIFLPNLYSFC